jgi:hypothetical protein
MTLDEAIKHAEEVAEEKQLKAHNLKQCKDYGNPKSTITSGVGECETCADEHRQLAEWLKDYKRLLEQPTSDDCVSRAETIKAITEWYSDMLESGVEKYDPISVINSLPPVTPARKVGKWISVDICNLTSMNDELLEKIAKAKAEIELFLEQEKVEDGTYTEVGEGIAIALGLLNNELGEDKENE